MAKRLRVISGPDQGSSWELLEGRTQSIGRLSHHNEICIHDPTASRIHCEVQTEGDRVIVRDLDSDLGTLVNGTRITAHDLQHGDVLRIGNTEFSLLSISDSPAPSPASAAVASVAAAVDRPAAAPAAAVASPAAPPPAPPPASLATDRLGELAGTVLGHYEVGSILGKGHCGFVFQARDQKTGQIVALRVLHPDFPKNDEEMQRFIRTIKAGLALHHPNLVKLLGAGRAGAHSWIAMEHVTGESAAQAIQRLATAGLGDWHLAFRAAVHLARALEAAHQHGSLHRNITPPNVLVGSEGRPIKLNDLFLAKALEGSLVRQLSLRTKVQCELVYLAPEQTYYPPVVDARTDLYSAGAVLYAMVTGRPPLTGTSMAETIAKIRQKEPAKPTEFDPFLPDVFETTLLKLLAKKPADRFQSAGDLLAELARVGEEMPA